MAPHTYQDPIGFYNCLGRCRSTLFGEVIDITCRHPDKAVPQHIIPFAEICDSINPLPHCFLIHEMLNKPCILITHMLC